MDQLVVDTLVGLTTAGSNVFRNPAYNLDEDTDLPGITVVQGPDVVINPDTEEGAVLTLYYRFLEVTTTCIVQVRDSNDPVSSLNEMAREVAVAMARNHTLGLNFVLNTIEGNTAPPELFQSERIIARLETTWSIHYQVSRTDPSQ